MNWPFSAISPPSFIPFGISKRIAVERENGGYKLRKHGGDRKSENYQVGHYQLDNVSKGGMTKSYILARLQRDHPDILADFYAGLYRSARQAGIAAG